MMDKNARTSDQPLEAKSSRGIEVNLTEFRRTNELLMALGLTTDISINGYGELSTIRFVSPTTVRVETVLDCKIYLIGFGDGHAELWLDEPDYVRSLNCHNVAVRYTDGILTIGDLKETAEAEEDRLSRQTSEQSDFRTEADD